MDDCATVREDALQVKKITEHCYYYYVDVREFAFHILR